MKKILSHSLVLILLVWLGTAPGVFAQTEEQALRLSLSRVFGYSSLAHNEIQGTMNLTASGPEDLARVVFYLDDNPIGEVSQAPFKLTFSTGNYALGEHTLHATGYTADGRELRSNTIRTTFVSAERGMQVGAQIAVPILALVLGAMLLSVAVPLISRRGKKLELPLGEPRNYGAAGGAICPRCNRPFPLHFFAVNLGPTHKLYTCPFCGKWAAMRRKSLADLRRAEAAELARAGDTGQVNGQSEAEKLRKELDESRFQNL